MLDCGAPLLQPMRITLVVPRLLALAPEVLAQAAPLSRLAALTTPTAHSDLDAALLSELSIAAAPAPLAALGAGVDVGLAWVIRADPVTMSVGRDDVRMDGLVDDLDPDATRPLLALLSAHFADDALAFVAPRADAWFAVSATPHDVETTSPGAAIGRPLRALMPSGAEAARWRRWITETQMLLHEHPFAGRGAAPVNGVWFSGGGVLPDRSRVPSIRARAASGRHGDVVRGISRLLGRDADPAADFDETSHDVGDADAVVLVYAPVESVESFEAAMRNVVAPALARLEHGGAAELTLLADGPRGAARWHTTRPTFLERIARRHATFAPPVAES